MFTRRANPVNTYVQVSVMAKEIQDKIEDAAGLIDMNSTNIKNVMIVNPAIKGFKNKIDSDLEKMYDLAKELEEKCLNLQRIMKG